jgi:NAD(P)H-hydrate epimerase
MENLTQDIIKILIKPRQETSHKGNYGHSFLMVGSQGKMGSAVIAARACLRTGTGLLTVYIPKDERLILQIAIPEAMLIMRGKEEGNLNNFSAIGIGCGIGTGKESMRMLCHLLSAYTKPLVLDADALNIIASDENLLKKIIPNTVLTPHPKEFDRLFGIHQTIEERIKTAIQKAQEYDIVIVLKGHKTIITHNGIAFLNSTGNAGLAKGGSGDALTGIITALLSQGYKPFEAAKIGVYIHGLAADLALETQSMESMLITDVIEYLGQAFKIIICE